MARHAARRLLQVIPTLFVLSLLVFLWLRCLPGGPATALLGDRATPERVAALETTLGLDRPLAVQYLLFLGRALTGDFGSSLVSAEDVVVELGRALPATIELAVAGMVLAVGIGIPLGHAAARRRGGLLDHSSMAVALGGIAVPVFLFAIVLKQVVAVELGWLPPSGRHTVGLAATDVTGFAVLDGVLAGEWYAAADAVRHLILPAIAISAVPMAVITRMTRAAVLEVLRRDYVRAADAKGLHAHTVTRRHVLRNALLPLATTVGLQAGMLLNGAVLTEAMFNIGGIGSLLADGLHYRDYPRLQALILLVAAVFVVVNLLVDLSYAVIDPRLRAP